MCENFLSLRPLMDVELLAAINAVLTGPPRSLWAAEKLKMHNWDEFKHYFLTPFLSTDYLAELGTSSRLCYKHQTRVSATLHLIIGPCASDGRTTCQKRGW